MVSKYANGFSELTQIQFVERENLASKLIYFLHYHENSTQ